MSGLIVVQLARRNGQKHKYCVLLVELECI